MHSPESRHTIALLLFAGAATILPNSILLAQNQTQLGDPAPLVRVALIAAIIVAAVAWILARFVAPQRAAIICGVAGYSFFSCSWIIWPGPMWARLTIWAIATGVATVVVLWLLGNSTRLLQLGAAFVSIAVVATTLIGFGDVATDQRQALAFADVEAIRTPNVYLFVLDAMGRPDILAEQFSLDLSDELAALETLGFETSTESTANYPRTHLSISSMLNSGYPTTEDRRLSTKEEFAHADATLGGDNALVSFMKAAGYQYWHASSGIWGHGGCQVRYADRCIGGEEGDDAELKSAIWNSTPFGRNPFGADPGQDPTTVVDSVLENRTENGQPIFVFSHILSPHNPYRFTGDCSRINIGSMVEGWQGKYIPEYKAQAQCLMQQLNEAMSRLIEADPEALIMLVSDHGPTLGLDFEHKKWTITALRQGLASFRVVRAPAQCRTTAPEAHSLVNTLPYLKACLEGSALNLTDVRHYVVSAEGLGRLDEGETLALRPTP